VTALPLRLEDVEFADGSVAHVVLAASAEPAPESQVFAAMVVLRDARGWCAVTWSPRRGEWGPPGGAREPGESVTECVVREVAEEVGLDLDPAMLRPIGHELFEPVTSTGRWPREGGYLQLYVAEWPAVGGALTAHEDDAVDPQWVPPEEFRARAGRRFWWPLVEGALRD
jgi:8-oxo-dGTP pyrophosphatase MutT (NUDIX family)